MSHARSARVRQGARSEPLLISPNCLDKSRLGARRAATTRGSKARRDIHRHHRHRHQSQQMPEKHGNGDRGDGDDGDDASARRQEPKANRATAANPARGLENKSERRRKPAVGVRLVENLRELVRGRREIHATGGRELNRSQQIRRSALPRPSGGNDRADNLQEVPRGRSVPPTTLMRGAHEQWASLIEEPATDSDRALEGLLAHRPVQSSLSLSGSVPRDMQHPSNPCGTLSYPCGPAPNLMQIAPRRA